MPQEINVRKMLSKVIDPELGKNIVEAGMVREIHIEGDQVEITLALTTDNCPLKSRLQKETISAAEAVRGIEQARVKFEVMNREERKKLIETLAPTMKMNKVGKIVAVMSGKGGVGKSSVTALLATLLQRQGLQIGVLDADVTGPSIPKLFGITGPVSGTPMGIVPIETQTGIKVMSTNLMLPEEDMAIIWKGPIVGNTIKQFWTDVAWGKLDYLLLDLPPGTSDATLTVMQAMPLDGVVMVTTPQSLSSMVVRKTVHMSQELDTPILGIIENMSYFIAPDTGTRYDIFGPSHTEEIAIAAGSPLLAELPIDPDLTHLADMGKIEEYDTPVGSSLIASFLDHVPAVEPKAYLPWLEQGA
jgi:Mrp family chromosome partitioning ATPase